jgi:hypothetical protein
MRKTALLLPLFLVGCSMDSPTVMSSLEPGEQLAARRAFAKNYTAPLSGAEEVPPVDTRARGLAHFQVSADGQSISYRLNVANIENVIMAHIHVGAPGVNDAVVVWLYPEGPPPQLIAGRFNGPLAVGSFDASDLVGPLRGADLEDLLAAMNSGNTYVNVHTAQNTGGEVRGQIRPGG